MGWKASMIIIQNPDNVRDDKLILTALGMGNRKFEEEVSLDDCLYPRDESMNIGYYNGCIIVCDDFQVTGKFIMDKMSGEETALVKLFPKSEILAVSCHSVTNFHGYALIKDGKKIRAKALSADGCYVNMGEPVAEEVAIYAQSQVEHGKHVWVFDSMPDDEFEESQLMEDFTFGMSKRLLGVRIDEADDLLDEVVFRKYVF